MVVPHVVQFGAGEDSTALLVGLQQRGNRPDAIVFADTGGERGRTYAHLEAVDRWCADVGFPAIVRVRYTMLDGSQPSLEQQCVERRVLPSIAYGRKACSHKFKTYPSQQWLKGWAPAVEAWASGGKVRISIGYNTDEERRVQPDDERFEYGYELIDWGWGREECEAANRAAGFAPGTSACFFCPNNKRAEIHALYREEPQLFWRAIAMEDAAKLNSLPGLGRTFAWRDMVGGHVQQSDLFERPMPCGCGT